MVQALFTSFANGVPVTLSDRLRISTAGPAGGITFAIVTRLLAADGTLTESTDEITHDYTNGPFTDYFELREGILAFISVTPIDSNLIVGQGYGRISVVRGGSRVDPPALDLASGYITPDKPLTFPTLPTVGPDSILGGWTQTDLNDPAAGAGFGVDIGSTAQINQLSFSLDTSAAVATRLVRVTVNGANNNILDVIANATQTATLTRRYFLWTGPNMPAAAGANIYIPFPDIILQLSDSISISADNMAAGDQFHQIVASWRIESQGV